MELACEKIRQIVTWLDYQSESFNGKLKSVADIEKIFDACDRYGLEFADKLEWESKEDSEYKLAVEVNEILGYRYYRT